MEGEVSFGAWVARQRKGLDLTRDQLARCVGCSVSALRKIENDERRPSRQMAELLAQCLQIPPDEHPRFIKVARGIECVERLGPSLPVLVAVRSRLVFGAKHLDFAGTAGKMIGLDGNFVLP